MRAVLLVAAALAACTPDITSGSYACGLEELCPEGQACNPADGTCVLPAAVASFACVTGEMQGNSPISLDCGSTFMGKGCLPAGDAGNSVTFSLAPTCTSTGIHASVSFAIAFEPLGMQLWDTTANQMIATDDKCTTGFVGAAEDQRCLVHAIESGKSYGVVVVPAGGGDCDGHCNFNHYNVTLQLAAP